MAKRGPKRYDEEDRRLIVEALRLMRDENFTASKAAKQFGAPAGRGTLISRQKRLERDLKKRIGSGGKTAIEQAIIIEQIILDTGTFIDYSGIIPPKRSVRH